ncbi:MAG: response regulator [Planctomycetota bacterium]
MNEPLHVLYVESNEDDAQRALQCLQDAGYETLAEIVQDESAYRESLSTSAWHIVLSDVTLPSFGALPALRLLRRTSLRVPFIIVSSSMSEETMVQCIELGADNLVLKNNLERLAPVVSDALERYEEREQREELLRQLRQAQKMEAVGRLAGGVAHDFNNMLTVIQGYGNILKRKLAPRGECVDEIEQLLGASNRAATLTRQLLAFSRSQPVQLQVLDIGRAVEDLRKMIGRLLGDDIKFEVDVAESTGSVRADPGQLEQVLVNLVVNARDAMPEGGTLAVRTDAVQLGAGDVPEAPGLRAGPYVRIQVRDSGAGMDAETQRHIFEPFFTTKDRDKGTGLGLATVYGIVRQFRGAIRVRSAPARGTTFEIFLPQVPAEESAPAEEQQTPLAEGRGSILLVEDDDAVRALLVSELQEAGYTLHAAPDAETALKVALEFDLLVTDVVMPGLSGPELAERLRARRPDLRVLFVSGFQDPERTRLPELDGRTAFLAKPFQPDELRAKVLELLP